MMQYYKKIEMNNLEVVQKKTLEFLEGKELLGFQLIDWDSYIKHCPEVLTAFEMYGLFPTNAATITTYIQQHSSIHIDYMDDTMPKARVNIPIKNCLGSRTEFYKGGDFQETTQWNGLKFYVLKDKNDSTCKKVDEFELDQATVFRAQEPHIVITNLETVPRVSLSFFMNKDPIFLLDAPVAELVDALR